ncbi:glycosyltransferase family 2 protein [Empedobacter falsenii]
MNHSPFISIIITCFNSEKTILETMDSVINQTYQNWECIIVDDKSIDDSLRVIQNYAQKDKRVVIVANERNIGHPSSLNVGLRNSQYEYIMFLDSDDILGNDCLERRIKYISDGLDFVVFPNYERFDKKIGDLPKDREQAQSIENPLRSFIIHKLPTSWNIMSPLWKKQSLQEIGNFNEKLTRIIDVELSCRALIYGLQYKVVFHQPDHFYRITNDSIITKSKREKFFIASMTFIEEIKLFTQQNSPEKFKKVEKYLYHFFLSVLAMTLVSPQFDEKDSLKLIECAKKNKLIHSNSWNLFSKKKTHKLSQLPIVRTLIWRGTNIYIKK